MKPIPVAGAVPYLGRARWISRVSLFVLVLVFGPAAEAEIIPWPTQPVNFELVIGADHYLLGVASAEPIVAKTKPFAGGVQSAVAQSLIAGDFINPIPVYSGQSVALQASGQAASPAFTSLFVYTGQSVKLLLANGGIEIFNPRQGFLAYTETPANVELGAGSTPSSAGIGSIGAPSVAVPAVVGGVKPGGGGPVHRPGEGPPRRPLPPKPLPGRGY
jgi:hypothetical protein